MAIRRAIFGRGLSWPMQTAPDGGFKKDIETTRIIQSSIALIMLTRPGERLMQPEFGSNLLALKHEPNDETTYALIRDEIFSAIDRWEPRIQNLSIRVGPNPTNDFAIDIFISYRLIGTNVTENFVFPFFLDSGGSP